MINKQVIDAETRYQFDAFCRLYENAITVRDGKYMFQDVEYSLNKDEEVIAFSSTDGSPIKLVSPFIHDEYMPIHRPFFDFYSNNSWFWMIPCEIPGGNVTGFVLRTYVKNDGSVGKKSKYNLFQVGGTMPIVFGLHRFDGFSPDMPIVLTEGVKDALFLKRFYPYVLAVLTNSVSEYLCDFISRMTSKVVIAFDVDAGGRKNTKKVIDRFSKLGVTCTRPYTTYKVKDWGNFFSIPGEQIDRHVSFILSNSFREIGYALPILY